MSHKNVKAAGELYAENEKLKAELDQAQGEIERLNKDHIEFMDKTVEKEIRLHEDLKSARELIGECDVVIEIFKVKCPANRVSANDWDKINNLLTKIRRPQ